MYGCKANTVFTIRALMRKMPFVFNIVLLFSCILLFGFAIRVCEAPLVRITDEMNYYRMKENLRILEQSRDQDGKRFKVIKVPLPDPIYLNTVIGRSRENNISGELPQWKVAQNWLPEKGLMNPGDSINWVAASSYLNYLVTNGAVLLPTYQKSGSSGEKEAKVRDIFSRVFPDRKLIFLDVLNLNYHGGGIHCITQQEPASPK